MSDLGCTPGYREAYNINPQIEAVNRFDSDGNPTGGIVFLTTFKKGDSTFPALIINWQDGPRGYVGSSGVQRGELEDPNGAFVEDVLWAALQRLEFFNMSKFRTRANKLAIMHIEQALYALKDRQLERSHRNVEGKHEV